MLHDRLSNIKSYLNEIWFDNNIDVIEHVFSSNAIVDSALFKTIGFGGKKDVSKNWVGALSDTGIEVNFIEELNDVVVAKWVCWGNHVKAFSEIQPTGEKLRIEGISTYKFSNSKVVEYSGFVNLHKSFNVPPNERLFEKEVLFDESTLKNELKMVNGVVITEKEIDCLSHLVCGASDLDIANLCNVKKTTVRTHKYNIFDKLGVKSKLELNDLLISCNKFHVFSEHSRLLRNN